MPVTGRAVRRIVAGALLLAAVFGATLGGAAYDLLGGDGCASSAALAVACPPASP